MIIKQAANNNAVGLVQDIPPKILVDQIVGQRMDARVIQSALAAEIVSIKVADSVMHLRTPVALQAGQMIELEWVAQDNKVVLKLIQAESKVNLQPSQQVAVEVIKVSADGRLLVKTLGNNALAVQQFDIDSSQLTKQFKVGEQLSMGVLSVKPLNIQLKPISDNQIIIGRLQQLLSQQVTAPQLKGVMQSLQSRLLPEPIQQAITNLVNSSLDKADLSSPTAFKQALALSGTFTELELLSQSDNSNKDFKANIIKLMAVLEAVITQTRSSTSAKDMNALPSQVLAALSAHGKTPQQLLHVLLAGNSVPSASSIQSLLPGLLNQEQATTLATMLAKPLASTTALGRNIPLNLAELVVLFKEVENVYNKLQLNQLVMLKDSDSANTTASWLFDVPIKDKHNLDLVQLQIDQHKKERGDEQDLWNVNLHLDTQNLGPVQATITVIEDDVKVIFRAERHQSSQLLEENMHELEKSLNNLGVNASHISCICGDINQPRDNSLYQTEQQSQVDITV